MFQPPPLGPPRPACMHGSAALGMRVGRGPVGPAGCPHCEPCGSGPRGLLMNSENTAQQIESSVSPHKPPPHPFS